MTRWPVRGYQGERMRALAAIAAALALAPGGARAGPTVSLNGVNIEGAVNQRFDNATVVIDAQGNVNILARGYAVSRAEPEPQAAPAAVPARPPMAAPAPRPGEKPARRYFLVAEQSAPGITEYDVAVFVNGRWVRELRADGDAEPFELTRFLLTGPNKVTMVATKHLAGSAPRSTSRDQTLKVIVGEGSAGGGTVYVDEPLYTMTRNAAETGTFTEEYTLVAR